MVRIDAEIDAATRRRAADILRAAVAVHLHDDNDFAKLVIADALTAPVADPHLAAWVILEASRAVATLLRAAANESRPDDLAEFVDRFWAHLAP